MGNQILKIGLLKNYTVYIISMCIFQSVDGWCKTRNFSMTHLVMFPSSMKTEFEKQFILN